MKKIIFIGLLLSSAVFSFTEKIYVHSGWNLKGTSNEIKRLSEFANKDIVSTIIVYRNGSFIKTISSIGSIKAGEGFWIYANKGGTLSFNTDGSSNNADNENPPSISRYYHDDIYENCNLENHVWGDWSNNWNNMFNNCENDNKASLKDIKLDLKKGWNLRGTSKSFRIKDILNQDCVISNGINIYTNNNFYKRDKDSSYYILGDMGFWINANKDCTISEGKNPPSL